MRLLLVFLMVWICSCSSNAFLHQFPWTSTAFPYKRPVPLAQGRSPYEAGPSRIEHVRTALTTILGSLLAFFPSKRTEALDDRTYREKKKGKPLVEGLLTLPNGKKSWLDMLDQDQREELGASSGTLFLVCKYQDTAVLGARVPMAEITFPFLFQFYADNLLGPPDLWEEYKLKDLYVVARVCASKEFPVCQAGLLEGQGLSKFIPIVEGIATNVRAGAGILLRNSKQS